LTFTLNAAKFYHACTGLRVTRPELAMLRKYLMVLVMSLTAGVALHLLKPPVRAAPPPQAEGTIVEFPLPNPAIVE